MQFTPSILEYSIESLEKKIKKININLEKFHLITKQQKGQVSLHLDFVGKYFAQNIKEMQSLEPINVFKNLEKLAPDLEKFYTVHLMGDTEDLVGMFEFFYNLTIPETTNITLLVPVQYYYNWQEKFANKSSFKIGIWLNKGKWTTFRFMPKVCYLLMTVYAGKSGQMLEDSMLTLAMNTVKTHPDSHFIVDGGWSVNFGANYQNLSIVSYTDFWKNF
jgi:pentose-5-phosphate-3-epimerase